MARMSTLLIGVMLFFSILAFNAQAQESRRIGLNTTLRTLGDEIKYIQELGINTIRMPLQWPLVKIRPGEYDWRTLDRLLKSAQTKQIEILFTICTTFGEETKKQKTQKGTTRIKRSPVELKEWVHFVEALANRYQGQGVNYEIENEVNGEAFWKGTLEDYLELLKAGYDVIKKADPRAKVLPSAMGCGVVRNYQLEGARSEAWKWHDSWLQPILSTKKFDVVNIHDYYFPSDIVANGLTFRSYLGHIHDLMKKSGLGDCPIWITETGFVSAPTEIAGRMDHGSYEKQAKWLGEAYRQAFELGVERIYWLLLRDRKEPYFGSMGLADAKGNPRPAWDALKQFK
jgi:Cellulase (glycosyl hydrolase family 5)